MRGRPTGHVETAGVPRALASVPGTLLMLAALREIKLLVSFGDGDLKVACLVRRQIEAFPRGCELTGSPPWATLTCDGGICGSPWSCNG